MAQLPWITPPATARAEVVGNATIGQIEIPVHGDLLWGETIQIAALLENEESTTTAAARLAEAIANGEGITLLEAYDLVQGAVMGDLKDERRDRVASYQSEIEQLRALFSRIGSARMAATVTAILCHRVTPDWTLDDTRKLPAALFDALWAFADREQRREPAAPMTEEEVGKPPGAKSRGRTTRKSRGPSSESMDSTGEHWEPPPVA